MTEVRAFEPPKVTDQEIRRASRLLKLPENAFHGEDGKDPRQEVLKCMEQIDVAACPGSGKTTLLVAKLAVLAEKWPYHTRGMCVLSHTNVARGEIETCLGNTAAGRRLLAYPHFIGTIHGFVNEFLALPWLRSQGYPVRMIDSGVCQQRRWYALPRNIRRALENNRHGHSILSAKTSDFGVGEVRWGKRRVLGRDTPTYTAIRDACRKSTEEGYFCYDEMFIWAGDLIDKVPGIVEVVRGRFPLLFIDEAQDNSEEQSSILHRVFLDGDSGVIRQRFGDANQAIFGFVGGEGATTDEFPDSAVEKDIPNSHRFGQKIADLADPLGVIPYRLKGHGPKKPLVSGAEEGPHTIFLFDDNSVSNVMDAYAGLLLETFSDQELREGTFTAVGQVHRPPDTETSDHFPRHVGQYWPEYDPELTSQDPKPQTFGQYVLAGVGKAKVIGEAFPAVEKIAEGILRLAGMAEGETTLRHRRHKHRHVLGLVDDCADVRERYEDLIAGFAVEGEVLTKETWGKRWCDVARQIAETIAGGALSSADVRSFLEWRDGPDPSVAPSYAQASRDNVYRFSRDGKEVAIRVGSIHSVKGETHTATLVLETFWHAHNLDKLKGWVTGDRKNWKPPDGVQQKSRLKLHYVAMTRPTHLLCLAMKQSTVVDSTGRLDPGQVDSLERNGWRVTLVDQCCGYVGASE